MRKNSMTMLISTGLSVVLILNGCGYTSAPELKKDNVTETAIPGLSDEKNESVGMPTETAESTNIAQNGPYGRISLSIPDGWNYETYPTDSEGLMLGMYGIHFYPESVTNGYTLFLLKAILKYYDGFVNTVSRLPPTSTKIHTEDSEKPTKCRIVRN